MTKICQIPYITTAYSLKLSGTTVELPIPERDFRGKWLFYEYCQLTNRSALLEHTNNMMSLIR